MGPFLAVFFSLLTTTSYADVSLFGIFQNQPSPKYFEEATKKLKITESSFYSNLSLSHGLSFIISQMEELRTKINESDSNKNIVFIDAQGTQSEMIKELLLIQEDMTSSSYNKPVFYDGGLGGERQVNNILISHKRLRDDVEVFFIST